MWHYTWKRYILSTPSKFSAITDVWSSAFRIRKEGQQQSRKDCDPLHIVVQDFYPISKRNASQAKYLMSIICLLHAVFLINLYQLHLALIILTKRSCTITLLPGDEVRIIIWFPFSIFVILYRIMLRKFAFLESLGNTLYRCLRGILRNFSIEFPICSSDQIAMVNTQRLKISSLFTLDALCNAVRKIYLLVFLSLFWN